MPNARNFNYHINANGGISAFNNPGGQVWYVAPSTYVAIGGGQAPSDSNNGKSPQSPFVTIQKGLDSAIADRGDIVALLPGTFTITAVLTMTKAGVSLMAAHGSAPRQISRVEITTATDSISMLDIDANFCVVDGIYFDHNTTTAAVPLIDVSDTTSTVGVVIRNCYLDMEGSGTTTDGIRLGDGTQTAREFLVEGCVIHDFDQDGIVVSDTNDEGEIRGCHVYDNVTANLGRYGISCSGDNVKILDNTVFCEGTAGIYLNGLELQAYGNNVAAWQADAICVLHAASSAGASGGNWLNAVAAGNLVDFTTSVTSPASDCSTGNVYASDPALAALTTATLDGT